MNRSQEKYLENLRLSKQLIKTTYPHGLTQDELIACVKEHAQQQGALKNEDDALLKSPELGLALKPEQITPEIAADLEDFSLHLNRFNEQTDTGLAYQIHKLLLEYARYNNDIDGQIRESYFCGLTLYYLNVTSMSFHINRFSDDVIKYFTFGASYLDRLGEFSNSETQGYILRSFGNIKLGYDCNTEIHNSEMYPARDDFDISMAQRIREKQVFSDPEMRKLAPGFDWDRYLYAVHFGIAYYMTHLRTGDFPELADLVYESAQYIYAHAEQARKDSHKMLAPRIMYIYNAARFHKGIIPISELLDFFYERVMNSDPTKFDTDNAFDNMYCALYFLDYYTKFGERSVRDDVRVTALMEHLQDYLTNMPINDSLSTIKTLFFGSMPLTYNQKDNLENHLLSYLLSFHQPTYIHCLMVSKISWLLMEELISVDPELIVQLGGYKNRNDLNKNKSKLLRKVYQFGMYHDIGKVMVIDFVSLYGRRLFDEEFEIIKEHCYTGYVVLNSFPPTHEFARGALGHHRFYNGRGGYPECYKRTEDLTQLIVDVLTVADSLDAATDNIGRSYARGINLERLINELREQSGSRYSPTVVKVFDSPGFIEKIEHALTVERPDAYYYVYDNMNEA